MPHRFIKKVTSIEIAVPGEFVGSAVVVVGSRLQDDVYNGATRTAQFRVEIARGHVYRLDGFKRRYQDLQKPRAFVVVDALDLVVVALAQLAIDFRLQRTTRVEELRMLESGASRARHDVQKALEIAIGAERHVFRQYGFELASRVRSLGLKDGSFRLHRDGFRNVSRLKDQVDALRRVHDHIDAGSRLSLKSRLFRGDRIRARRQISEYVVAALVRSGSTADPGVRFRNRHLDVGHCGPRRIRHRAEQSRIDRLPHDWYRKPQEYCPEQYGHGQLPQFDRTSGGRCCKFFGRHCVRRIQGAHPWEIRTKQFFHDITPLASKRRQPRYQENQRYAWN